VLQYDIIGSEADAFYLNALVSIHNPSPVGFANLGQLSLDVYENETRSLIGTAIAANVGLPGGASVTLACNMTISRRSNDFAISRILSRAMNGEVANLYLRGTNVTTSIPLMRGALVSMRGPLELLPLPAMPMMRSSFNEIPVAVPQFPANSSLCSTTAPAPFTTLNGLYVAAHVVLTNPFSTALTLHTMDMAGYWDVDEAVCPTAYEEVNGTCNAGPQGAGIDWPMKLFETPPSPIDYDFTVKPKVESAVITTNLCYPQALLNKVFCGLNGVFLSCLTSGYKLDTSGVVPLEVFATIKGSATASIGKFTTSANYPLTITRPHLPLLMRAPTPSAP